MLAHIGGTIACNDFVAIVTFLSLRSSARQERLGTAHIITSPLQDLPALPRISNLSPVRSIALGDKVGLGSKTFDQGDVEPRDWSLIIRSFGREFRYRSGTATYRNAYRLLRIDGSTVCLYSPTCGC